MKLSCDVASLRIDNEENGACMFVRESKVDGASGAGSPARQFLAVGNQFVMDVQKNLERIIQVNLFMGTFARSHQVPDLGAISMKDRAKD